MIAARPDVTDQRQLADLLTQRRAKVTGTAFRCPWHIDHNASGSIYADPDGHWRAKCHSCGKLADAVDIAAELAGLDVGEYLRRTADTEAPAHKSRPSEPTPKRNPRRWPTLADAIVALGSAGDVTGTYRYENGDAHPALVVLRIETGEPDPATGKRAKTFRQLHHDGEGWTASAPPKPWPIYRLPEIRAARSVVIVEGEKAADALAAIGITATTSPCGAGKAEHADVSSLAGKRVVLWPDHDDPGAKHMDQVAEILAKLPTPPETVRRINPAALSMPPKGDAVDWIAAQSGDANALRDACIAILRSAPEVGPPSPMASLLAAIDDEAAGRSALIAWPWPMLTRLSRSLLPGKVCVLAGAPGGAKSWMALQCMPHWINAGIPVAMLALEERWEWHGRRAMAQLDRSPNLLDPEWVRANPDDARECAARHGDMLDALGKAYTCRGNLTLGDCAAWIEERCRAGVRVLVVDPVSLAIPGTERNSWDADAKFIARAKAAVEASGASLVLVTHPRKSTNAKAGAPGLDDLAGGAVYQRAAASVLWLGNLPTPTLTTVEQADGHVAVVEAHKTIRLLKTRDATGCGRAVAFRFVRLQFQEAGVVAEGASDGVGSSRPKRSARIAAAPADHEDAFDPAKRAAGDA